MNQDLNQQVVLAVEGLLVGSTGWVRINCPFCEDTRARFGLKVDRGWWGCFNCHVEGRLDPEDCRALDMGPDPMREADPVATDSDVEVCEGFMPLAEEPAASAVVFAPAREYLRTRRLTRRAVREGHVGATLEGPAKGRVVVPILSGSGGWLGWVGRTYTGSDLKYRYAKGMRRGEMLYNEQALDVETDKPVLVVEGTLDALAFWPDAVAVLGDCTDWQRQRLVSSRRPVVTVLDGDAWEKGWALSQRLRLEGVWAGAVRLPPKKDPDEVAPGLVWEAAEKALQEAEAVHVDK